MMTDESDSNECFPESYHWELVVLDSSYDKPYKYFHPVTQPVASIYYLVVFCPRIGTPAEYSVGWLGLLIPSQQLKPQ